MRTKRGEEVVMDAPEQFERVRLADVADVVRGVTYKKDDATEKPAKGMIPILRANNIQDGVLEVEGELVYVPRDLVSDAQVLRKGDIVIATSSGSKDLVGKAAPVRADWHGSFGAFCAVVRAKEDIHPLYLVHFLGSPEYKDLIRKKALGVNINNLRRGDLEELEIPLAPLPEQRRIVSAIELQLGRLDAAVARLQGAKAKLKRYKQAVLKAAYTGEGLKPIATKQENGAQWLETILKKRKVLAGKNAKYKEPIAPDHEGMPELPEGWSWSSLEQITHPTEVITYGVIKLGDDTPGGVPTIRSSDVKSLRLVLETVKTIDKAIADNYKRTYLEGGEVIFAIRGTIGGVVVVPEECKGYNIAREVARIKLVDERLNQYVAICLAGNYLTAWFGTRLKGIAYTGINIEILRQAPIPIPPPDVLARIIELTDDRLQRHDDLIATLDAELVRSTRLRQAVLKRAFEGRLV